MSGLILLGVIAGQRVAVDAAMIEAVIDLNSVTPIPLSPPHFAGLAAIRSQVVTVIDAAAALGLERQAPQGRALLIVVEGHRYAIRLESVADVVPLPSSGVDQAIATPGAWAAIALGRVNLGYGFAVMVDPARLVSPTVPAVAA